MIFVGVIERYQFIHFFNTKLLERSFYDDHKILVLQLLLRREMDAHANLTMTGVNLLTI